MRNGVYFMSFSMCVCVYIYICVTSGSDETIFQNVSAPVSPWVMKTDGIYKSILFSLFVDLYPSRIFSLFRFIAFYARLKVWMVSKLNSYPTRLATTTTKWEKKTRTEKIRKKKLIKRCIWNDKSATNMKQKVNQMKSCTGISGLIFPLAPCVNTFEGCVNRTPRIPCILLTSLISKCSPFHAHHICVANMVVCHRGCGLPTQLEIHTNACLASTSNALYSVIQIKFDEIHLFYTHMHYTYLNQFSISPKLFIFFI